jgi:hypothetical protein
MSGDIPGNTSLRRFLFEEYVDIYGKYNADVSPFLIRSLRSHADKIDKYRIFLSLYGLACGARSLLNSTAHKGRKRILCDDYLIRYPAILKKLSGHARVTLLGDAADPVFWALNLAVDCAPIHSSVRDLYRGILDRDEALLRRGLDGLEGTIEGLDPDIVVLGNDALPVNRAILLAARRLGIPTVEVQHGVYQEHGILPTGLYADHLFVWGEFFKDLYVSRDIRKGDSIRTLGYPYEIKRRGGVRGRAAKKTLCYLGQDYEKFSHALLNIKLDTVHELQLLCAKYGFEFVYRPHPSEDTRPLRDRFHGMRYTPPRDTVFDSIRKYDLFVSFNSTALIEAALHHKLAVQLRNYPADADDFEALGICPTFTSAEQMAPFLKRLSAEADWSGFRRDVDRTYIEIPDPDPGSAFIRLIEGIPSRIRP